MTYVMSFGSVSSGSLLTEDLLEAFEGELREIYRKVPEDKERAERLIDAVDAWLSAEERDEEAGSELVNELIDLFNEYCPAYAYFGTNEGDGADFGVWLSSDSLDELPQVSDPGELDELGEDEGEAVFVNDHGNVTLYARDETGTFKEVWSIV